MRHGHWRPSSGPHAPRLFARHCCQRRSARAHCTAMGAWSCTTSWPCAAARLALEPGFALLERVRSDAKRKRQRTRLVAAGRAHHTGSRPPGLLCRCRSWSACAARRHGVLRCRTGPRGRPRTLPRRSLHLFFLGFFFCLQFGGACSPSWRLAQSAVLSCAAPRRSRARGTGWEHVRKRLGGGPPQLPSPLPLFELLLPREELWPVDLAVAVGVHRLEGLQQALLAQPLTGNHSHHLRFTTVWRGQEDPAGCGASTLARATRRRRALRPPPQRHTPA